VSRIAVLGAGAWGTALAQLLAAAGHETVLWARDPALAAEMARSRANTRYLPGLALDPRLAIVSGDPGIPAAIRVAAVPAQHLRALLGRLPADAPLVVTAKGIETATGRFMDELAAEALPGVPVALLSGPSFAEEVVRGLPAAVTLACRDRDLGEALARTLAQRHFRIYWTDDVRGVALGGALKNVLAIAAGVVTGRGLGENARAALVTRGLAEMMRLGAALGARADTMMGLSGLGDLLLTATSAQSRNTALGIALGRGGRLDALLSAGRGVVEGVYTAAAVVRLARAHGVEVPIAAAVDAVVRGVMTIDGAIEALLGRPQRAEGE
jgi:glycerol-3-phosphate dehydrogenase (NAD(P)+)